jgi:5-methylcytosine-specific restriction enzyme A
MPHDQHDRPTIDARAPAPQHTCCHHISLPTATRSRCLPSSLPRRRACLAPNALGDTSFMTAPPRAAATPYTRPAPPHWQSVDLAPHSRCARHTWTHCHPDSVRVGWWPVASSERDTTKPPARDRARWRERTGPMPYAAPRRCARCGAVVPAGTRCRCRPAWEGSTNPPSTSRWRTLRAAKLRASPICETPGCRLLATEVDHIIPVSIGGDRWDWSNLSSTCHDHHAAKNVVDSQRGRTRPR